MRLRSIKSRGVASLASTTLAAGALVVPAVLLANPAQAASGPISYTCDLNLSGGFAQYGGERAATLTFDTDAAEVAAVGDEAVTPVFTATLAFAQEYLDLFVPSPVNRMGGTMTATTDTNGAAGTSVVTFEQWNRGGGMNTPVENFELGGTGVWSEISFAEAGDIELGVTELAGDLYIGTTFSPNNTTVPTTCTPDDEGVVAVDSIAVGEAPVVKDLALDCSFSGNDFAYDTDVTFSAQATAAGVDVTAELEDMPNTAPAFVNLPGQEFVATLDTDLGDLVGTHTGDFQGGTPVVIPAMSGSVAGSAGSLPIAVEGFNLAVGSSASIPCTLDAPVQFELPVAPVVKDLALDCTFSGNDFAYDTDVAFTAQATTSGSVNLAAVLADEMPNTAPPFVSLTGQEFVATLGTNLGDLTGSHTGDFQGGTPVAIPAMNGSVAGSAGALSVSVEEFTLAVGSAATIPCTLAAPAEFTVDVAAAPEPPVVAPQPAKSTAKVATAKYKKKQKKAVVKIKVTAGKVAATGKVKIAVKVGKTKVITKNVKINKKGVAKLVLKKGKLKKKGKYKVNAQYAGNADFTASKAKGNFKVK